MLLKINFIVQIILLLVVLYYLSGACFEFGAILGCQFIVGVFQFPSSLILSIFKMDKVIRIHFVISCIYLAFFLMMANSQFFDDWSDAFGVGYFIGIPWLLAILFWFRSFQLIISKKL